MARWAITSTFFVNLINRLGVRPPPANAFTLEDTVQPVSLVDSDVAIVAAAASPLLDTPVGGDTVNPGAGAVVADTGALPAGNYQIYIQMGNNWNVNTSTIMAIQRRDSANAANIWQHIFAMGAASQTFREISLYLTLQANERVRIVDVNGGTYTSSNNIWSRLN